MQRLSDLDASFLYLENDRSPMLIGGIYLFSNDARERPIDFSEFSSFIASRLHVAPFFRQRLVEVPLNLDRPFWVDDPEFDLKKHLEHIHLKNGSAGTLKEIAATLFSRPLERDRPLWSITYVDGLGNDQKLKGANFAMIVRVHHSAIDHLSGEEVMSALLSFSEAPSPFPIMPHKWSAKPLPSRFKLIGGAYGNALSAPFRVANLAIESAASTFYSLIVHRLERLNLPSALFSAPRTLFNNAISKKRKIDYIEIPLARLKHIRKTIGDVTINDVVMGICAEALRQYLSTQDALPNSSLIAMSPISVRSKSLQTKTGNQLSAALIALATDIENPILRIRKIHENAISSESYTQAISATRLTELMPSSVIALSARIYAEFQLAQRHKPIFNLPITNVPGPQTPLYLNGAKLISQIGTAPLFDGIGVVLVAISYNGNLSISITSCPSMMENPANFSDYLHKATDTIESALTDETLLSETLTTPSKVPQTGFIEDVIALVNNLFSVGSSNENKENK